MMMRRRTTLASALIFGVLVCVFTEGSAEEYKFDLAGQEAPTSAGFTKRGAGGSNFPPLVGSGLSWAHFTFEPCGVNAHHLHPFGGELIYVIEGNNLEVGWTDARTGNPGTLTKITLNQGETTLLPLGSVHYQINQSCEKVVTISALSSDSAGAVTVAPALLAFGDDAVAASLGIGNGRVRRLREAQAMRTVQQACMARCNHR